MVVYLSDGTLLAFLSNSSASPCVPSIPVYPVYPRLSPCISVRSHPCICLPRACVTATVCVHVSKKHGAPPPPKKMDHLGLPVGKVFRGCPVEFSDDPTSGFLYEYGKSVKSVVFLFDNTHLMVLRASNPAVVVSMLLAVLGHRRSDLRRAPLTVILPTALSKLATSKTFRRYHLARHALDMDKNKPHADAFPWGVNEWDAPPLFVLVCKKNGRRRRLTMLFLVRKTSEPPPYYMGPGCSRAG